jgi:tripartite ATP-independent transporter DctP family solute receptor
MKKLLVLLLSFALIFTFAVGCGGDNGGGEAAPAGDEEAPAIEISIGHTDSGERSTNVWGEWLGEQLSAETDGRITVTMYPDGQAGDDPDIAAGVKLGTVTMYFGLASVISSIVGDQANGVELPYLYTNYDNWVEGTFNNGGLELFNAALDGSGYTCLDMLYNGMRNVISNKKVYHNSADLNGQKVRISQNELNVRIWQAMGANPTPMAWGEVITSLSTGAVDALDHSIGVFNDFNINEMAPHLTITNHCSSPYPLVCSTDWLNSLSDADRELITSKVKEMCENQRNEERENELGYITKFQEAGTEVYELSAEETAAFTEACQTVYDYWTGLVGQETMDAWLATVPK